LVILTNQNLEIMKKLVLILVCAFASFAFAENASLEKNIEVPGPCDGYGGVVTINLTVNCDGDDTPEFQGTVNTCADQAIALVKTYKSLCQE